MWHVWGQLFCIPRPEECWPSQVAEPQSRWPQAVCWRLSKELHSGHYRHAGRTRGRTAVSAAVRGVLIPLSLLLLPNNSMKCSLWKRKLSLEAGKSPSRTESKSVKFQNLCYFLWHHSEKLLWEEALGLKVGYKRRIKSVRKAKGWYCGPPLG